MYSVSRSASMGQAPTMVWKRSSDMVRPGISSRKSSAWVCRQRRVIKGQAAASSESR